MTLKSRLKHEYYLNLKKLNDTPYLQKSIIDSLDNKFIFDLTLTEATNIVWYLTEDTTFSLENLLKMFNDEIRG